MAKTEFVSRVVSLDQDKVFLLMPNDWWKVIDAYRTELLLKERKTSQQTMDLTSGDDWPMLGSSATKTSSHGYASESDLPAPLCHVRSGCMYVVVCTW